jgi:1-acyl-sn-glycerol-3-phosphate acyltransferase
MLSPVVQSILAIVVLALLAVILVARLVGLLRAMPFTPIQSVLWGYNYLMARILWRATIEGQFDLPAGTGAVIVCNHRGPIDPSFVALATKRVVHWMVAKEFWTPSLVAWLLRTTGSIPVSRGGIDTAATKMAIRLAQQGEVLGLFPEGRINKSDELLMPGRPGAAMIALRARVPIVPCYLEGSPDPPTTFGFLFMPAKARLVIGRPIDLSPYYSRENDRKVLEEITKRMMREIARLAGQPDFEPRLAGRFYRPDLAEASGDNGGGNGQPEKLATQSSD